MMNLEAGSGSDDSEGSVSANESLAQQVNAAAFSESRLTKKQWKRHRKKNNESRKGSNGSNQDH